MKWGKVVVKYILDANAQLASLRTGQQDIVLSGANIDADTLTALL